MTNDLVMYLRMFLIKFIYTHARFFLAGLKVQGYVTRVKG